MAKRPLQLSNLQTSKLATFYLKLIIKYITFKIGGPQK